MIDSRTLRRALVLAVTALAGLVPTSSAAALASSAPVGHLDSVRTTPTTLHLTGWALDPDAGTHTVAVAVFIDGRVAGYVAAATVDRPDVGAALGLGSAHGFDLTLAWSGGAHQICAAAINAPGTVGADVTLGCVRTTGNPFGNLESVALNGDAVVTGWAIDPDTADSAPVAVYVDGVLTAYAGASLPRADVGTAYPGYGASHGFRILFGVSPGAVHRVCVAAQNVAGTAGGGVFLGCGTVDARAHFAGSLDTVEQTDFGLRVVGWIADKDAPTAVLPLAVFVDGQLVAYVRQANLNRPDVAAATPYGAAHGYDSSFFTTPGTHQLCLTSTSLAGVQASFVCRTVTKQPLK